MILASSARASARIDGSLSKEILQTGKFADAVPTPAMLRLVNDTTITDLRAFRAQAAADSRIIDDLQFMIGRDGHATLVDPARVRSVGRGGAARREMRSYLDRIDRLIRDFRRVARESRP